MSRTIRTVALLAAAAAAIPVTLVGPAGATLASSAPSVPSGTATATSAVAVPWWSVGDGWTAALHRAPGIPSWRGSTVFLVSPGGARYATTTRVPKGDRLLGVSDDGARIVTVHQVRDDATVSVRNLRSGTRSSFAAPDEFEGVTFLDPLGTRLLVTAGFGPDGSSVRAVTTTGRLVRTLHSPSRGELSNTSVVPTPDGSEVLLVRDGRLRRVDVATARTVRTYSRPSSAYPLCHPKRWWNGTTAVTACGQADGTSPHTIYLRGNDGASRRLTAKPGPSGFGWINAWYHAKGAVGEDMVGCGADIIRRIPTLRELPWGVAGGQVGLVNISGRRAVALAAASDCGDPDQGPQRLIVHNLDTGTTRTALGGAANGGTVVGAAVVARNG